MALHSIDSILHPTDFSDTDFGAVAHALRIALAAKAKLTFLHVGPKGADIDWAAFPKIRGVLASWGVVKEDASHEDVIATGLHVRKSLRKGDDIVAEIAGEARSGEADLIVLATHQRQGIARWLNKPLAETIAREVRKPTLFVPRQIEGFVRQETGHPHLSHILVPVARSPKAKNVVEAAILLGRLLAPGPVTLTLFHVGSEGRVPSVEVSEPKGWTIRRVCRPGDVVTEVLDECEEQGADLIAMATKGREGFLDALRGTTTEQVLRAAKCPVLAVPA